MRPRHPGRVKFAVVVASGHHRRHVRPGQPGRAVFGALTGLSALAALFSALLAGGTRSPPLGDLGHRSACLGRPWNLRLSREILIAHVGQVASMNEETIRDGRRSWLVAPTI